MTPPARARPFPFFPCARSLAVTEAPAGGGGRRDPDRSRAPRSSTPPSTTPSPSWTLSAASSTCRACSCMRCSSPASSAWVTLSTPTSSSRYASPAMAGAMAGGTCPCDVLTAPARAGARALASDGTAAPCARQEDARRVGQRGLRQGQGRSGRHQQAGREPGLDPRPPAGVGQPEGRQALERPWL